MTLALSLTLAGLALAAPQEAAAAEQVASPFGEVAMPTLAREDLAAWRAYLLPTGSEAAFEELPWRATFADGLRSADEAGMPLLLWVMNGHPLGCT
jgi:hypothetical protein